MVIRVAGVPLPLLRVLRAGPRARVLVPLGLIGAYVPLAGAGPSLQRAGVMGAAGLVALAAGRPASRWYALELAAAVTLAVNPRVVGDPGWQLSFAAVAGILLLAGPIQRPPAGPPPPPGRGGRGPPPAGRGCRGHRGRDRRHGAPDRPPLRLDLAGRPAGEHRRSPDRGAGDVDRHDPGGAGPSCGGPARPPGP